MRKMSVIAQTFLCFFRWFAKPSLRDHIEGDLIELYHTRVGTNGKTAATRLVIKEVIRLFRPSIIRSFEPSIHIQRNAPVMIKSYFTIAFRNLRHSKTYAAINITGLAVGIAAFLLLFMVIRFEKSFDNFHKNKDDIYRVVSVSRGNGGVGFSAGVPFPTSQALRIDYPQLANVAAIFHNTNQQVFALGSSGETVKKFKEENGVFYAEPQLFNMLDFEVISGDIKKSLAEPNNAFLTRSTAVKYFDNWENAIGKTIRIGSNTAIKITGILEDAPANSDFPFKIVSSYSTLLNTGMRRNMTDWVTTISKAYTFVQFTKQYTPQQFDASLNAFVKKYKPAEYVKDGMSISPVSDMHFDARFGNFNGHVFSRELITVLELVGIFLLVIACVNFINLATAQAVNRSKEVGVRKVLGSRRGQLIAQFIGETGLITFFAMIISCLIVWLVLPMLNTLLHLRLSFNPFTDPAMLLFLLAVVVIVTLLSGFYPALVLSGYNPIQVLKNKIVAQKSNTISLRRALVVLQFVIAQVLVIGTIVVVKQMNYFSNALLGFNKEAIINISVPGDSLSRSKREVFKTELKQQPGVEAVSFSFAGPSDNHGWSSDFRFNNDPKPTDIIASLKWADTGYFRMYDLRFAAGRAYFPGDTVKEFVVNEKLLEQLGIHNPAEAINKQIDLWDGKVKGLIVGVIKDFHTTSLRDPIAPVLMSTWNNVYQIVNLKVRPDHLSETMASLEKVWNRVYPGFVFDYQFLDEKIAGFYRQERQLAVLYQIFAGIAIFISCLGLYGLVSFMAVQRNKEMGIRKVLGASVGNIVFLLSKEFTLLIIIAFAVASPIAYYFMHKWLQDYAFKIDIGIGIFLITILASIIIAWLTVGYRAFKAALVNPAKSLRTE
jgi:putative ABC transport system permease protein